MQIVINISKEDYNFVKRQIKDGITNPLKICIANGTPLPTGHGRLIDADALKKYIDDCDCCVGCENESYGCADRCKCPDYLDEATERIINNQPTVIEADTAEEDKS